MSEEPLTSGGFLKENKKRSSDPLNLFSHGHQSDCNVLISWIYVPPFFFRFIIAYHDLSSTSMLHENASV